MALPTAWDVVESLHNRYGKRLQKTRGVRITRKNFMKISGRRRLERSFKTDVQDAGADWKLIIGIGKKFVAIALDY